MTTKLTRVTFSKVNPGDIPSIAGFPALFRVTLSTNIQGVNAADLGNAVLATTQSVKDAQKAVADAKVAVEQASQYSGKGVKDSSLKNMGDKFPNYSVQSPQGLFPTTDKVEASDKLSSGRWDGKPFSLLPEYLDEIQFRFFDNATFPYTILPYRKFSGTTYNLPLTTIHSVAHTGPVGDNPFRAVELYSAGIYKFRQESPSTISGILSGSFELLVRVNLIDSQEQKRSSGRTPIIAPDLWFCLTTPDGSPLNSRDRYALANVYNWGQVPLFKMIPQQWAIAMPDYAGLTPLMAKVNPIAHKLLPGTIDAGSVSETLTPPDGTEVKTTDWISIGGENYWYVELSDATQRSNRARMQFKDAGGYIWYDVDQSVGNASAAKLWKMPPNAVQARIAFVQKGGTAADIVIRPVPLTIDPSVGMWARYQVNVNQIVDFIPNVNYCFELAFWNGQQYSLDSNSFVVVSGGLKFSHNGRTTRATNLAVAQDGL